MNEKKLNKSIKHFNLSKKLYHLGVKHLVKVINYMIKNFFRFI